MIKLIIVNFNQRTHLDSLIESIRDQNDWEAFVVDNSGELVGQSFLNTKIINPKKNLGYLKGLEYGLNNCEFSNDDFIVFCNPDLVFEHNFFDTLMKKVDIKKMDLIAPSIINSLGNNCNPNMVSKMSKLRILIYDFEYSNYISFRIIAFTRFILKSFLEFLKKYKSPKNIERMKIFIPHGACMIFRGFFFENDKNFNYDIFLWGEEPIIAHEVRKRGGEVIFEPKLKVNHNEGSVTSKVPSQQRYSHWKNSYKIMRKYLR